MSINLEEISSLNGSNADSRLNSTLHSPSLSSLSLNRSSISKDYSLNFSIKNDDLSERSSVRLEMADHSGYRNPFRK
jgi:hypothetical protein